MCGPIVSCYLWCTVHNTSAHNHPGVCISLRTACFVETCCGCAEHRHDHQALERFATLRFRLSNYFRYVWTSNACRQGTSQLRSRSRSSFNQRCRLLSIVRPSLGHPKKTKMLLTLTHRNRLFDIAPCLNVRVKRLNQRLTSFRGSSHLKLLSYILARSGSIALPAAQAVNTRRSAT